MLDCQEDVPLEVSSVGTDAPPSTQATPNRKRGGRDAKSPADSFVAGVASLSAEDVINFESPGKTSPRSPRTMRTPPPASVVQVDACAGALLSAPPDMLVSPLSGTLASAPSSEPAEPPRVVSAPALRSPRVQIDLFVPESPRDQHDCEAEVGLGLAAVRPQEAELQSDALRQRELLHSHHEAEMRAEAALDRQRFETEEHAVHASSLEAEVRSLRQECGEYDSALSDLRGAQEGWARAAADRDAMLQDIQNDAESYRGDRDTAQQEIAALLCEQRDFRAELAHAASERDLERQHFEMQHSGTQQDNSGLLHERRELQEGLGAAQQEIAALRRENRDLQASHDGAQQEAGALLRDRQSLQAQLGQLDGAQQEVAVLLREQASWRASLEGAQQEASALLRERRDLQAALEAVQQDAASLARARRDLQANLDSTQQDASGLMRERREIHSELSFERSSHRDAKDQLDATQRRFQDTHSQLGELQLQHESTLASFRQAQAQNDGLQRDLQKAKQLVEKSGGMADDHQRIEAELARCQSELQEVCQAQKQEQLWSSQLRQQNEQLSADLRAMTDLSDSLRAEILGAGQHVNSQHAECTELRIALEQQRLEVHRLHDALASANRENQMLTQQLRQPPPVQQAQTMHRNPTHEQPMRRHSDDAESQASLPSASQMRPGPLNRRPAAERSPSPSMRAQGQWEGGGRCGGEPPPRFVAVQGPHPADSVPKAWDEPPHGQRSPGFPCRTPPGGGHRSPQAPGFRAEQFGGSMRVPPTYEQAGADGAAAAKALRGSVGGFLRQQRPPSQEAEGGQFGTPNATRRASTGEVAKHSVGQEASEAPGRPGRATRDAGSVPVAPVSAPHLSEGDAERDRKSSALEKQLMLLNSERQVLDSALMKFPTNTAGKTLAERRQKREAEQRIEEVDRTISQLRQQLRRLG